MADWRGRLIRLWAVLALVMVAGSAWAVNPYKVSDTLDAAQDTVTANKPGMGTVAAQWVGSGTLTVTWEATVDGSTWVTVSATNANTGAVATTATTAGIYIIPAAGYQQVRGRVSAYTSGTPVLTLSATDFVATSVNATVSGALSDTELPAAVAMGDNITAADSPTIGSFLYGWDGSNFDRIVTFPGAADGRNTTNTGLLTQGFGYVYNGTTWDRMRGNTTGTNVQGAGAIGTAIGSAGNPIVAGGSDGVSMIALPIPSNQTDGVANARNRVEGWAYGFLSNGTSWDRQRNNIEATALASAARTTTQTVAVTNYNGRAIHVILNVTSAGTGSITLSIQGLDPVSGNAYTLLSGAAVTTNSTNVYKVGPGLTAAANSVANDYLPRSMQLTITANNANSMTYSCGYSLMAN